MSINSGSGVQIGLLVFEHSGDGLVTVGPHDIVDGGGTQRTPFEPLTLEKALACHSGLVQ